MSVSSPNIQTGHEPLMDTQCSDVYPGELLAQARSGLRNALCTWNYMLFQQHERLNRPSRESIFLCGNLFLPFNQWLINFLTVIFKKSCSNVPLNVFPSVFEALCTQIKTWSQLFLSWAESECKQRLWSGGKKKDICFFYSGTLTIATNTKICQLVTFL